MKRCSTCTSPQRAQIDTALLANEGYRDIAARFGVSSSALCRHKRDHIAIHVERPCQRCGTLFSPKGNAKYCSEACSAAARQRTCGSCGKTFHVRQDNQVGHYCSRQCILNDVRALGIEAAEKVRHQQGRIEVPCVCPDCPRLHVLISVQRNRAIYAHHSECEDRYRALVASKRGYARRGAVLTCERCKREIGYRKPSRLDQKLCRACATQQTRGTAHPNTRRGEMRVCALPECSNVFYAKAARIKHSKTGRLFCCPEHAHAGARTAVSVRCRACNAERRYEPSKLPVDVDRSTMTWTCPTCRPHKSGMVSFTCLHCDKAYRRRTYFGAHETREHFCSAACRRLYHREVRRRATPCRRCGSVIERRGKGNVYCSWDCYIAAKTGRPNRHYRPSKAELRVIEKWRAGVRGVRPLARASEASVNTVQKLMRTGKIAS